jgi:penicillin V acylase-like amidase (Ntn superfamily)
MARMLTWRVSTSVNLPAPMSRTCAPGCTRGSRSDTNLATVDAESMCWPQAMGTGVSCTPTNKQHKLKLFSAGSVADVEYGWLRRP